MQPCVRIWRNLHSDIEIDRNQRSEELLKLGGGQGAFSTMLFHADIYLFNVNYGNIRTLGAICSKLTIKTPQRPC